jgi:cyclophilin family peptidyl-prolyl cis-trans isomerase
VANLELDIRRSEVLDQYLALHRELAGRFAWEVSLVPNPLEPGIAGFGAGVRAWHKEGLDELPAWLATVRRPGDLVGQVQGAGPRRAARQIADGLTCARPLLDQGLASLENCRAAAERDLRELLPLERLAAPLRAALGVGAAPLRFPLYLVPLAPNPPGLGFLVEDGRLASAYADCRRFTGSALADSVLTLLGWALVRNVGGPDCLPDELARRLPGTGPYHRRLRVLLAKLLIEITAGELVHDLDAGHRPCVDVLGSAWRYPRLHAVAARHWRPYLRGERDRAAALTGIQQEVSAWAPHWYVDRIDASSLAADFYLLEYLAAAGDASARRRLVHWLPQAAQYFAGQLDLIIGAELGHYERVSTRGLAEPLAAFLLEVTRGDSRVAWPRARARLGQAAALALAADAFDGPGAEFGGEAWAPVASMLRRYVTYEIPASVFVDQCFTLEHNNGCLFDKYFDTDSLPAVLDAQAGADLAALASHASGEGRRRWESHLVRLAAGHDPAWLGGLPREADSGGAATKPASAAAGPAGTAAEPARRQWAGLSVPAAPPGTLGCGSAGGLEQFAAQSWADPERPIRVRRQEFWTAMPSSLRRYQGSSALLVTSLGEISVRLWPELAPYTVDNFIELSQGRRAWRDPVTGHSSTGRFYDGVAFHRQVPGFLIQCGDRSGTGQGGPGYRVPDEITSAMKFDRSFLVAMANTGPGSAGSQFFITLKPVPHLNGAYTQFGLVPDAASRNVVTRIAASREPVVLRSVTVSTR